MLVELVVLEAAVHIMEMQEELQLHLLHKVIMVVLVQLHLFQVLVEAVAEVLQQ